MRQPISWSALADASVGVWGLGVEGQASVRRLRTLGVAPVLVDDTPPAPSLDGFEVLATGSGGLATLARCDVVIKSPGISRYRPEVAELEAAGVVVSGGLGLFLQDADPDRVVCITGTKGKSTTTALAVHLLTGLGYRARAGGNIGHPPWDPAQDDEPEYWIIETSSFQVPDLATAPGVVAVTSLSPDHLDWHGTVERYYADKLSLCTKPGVGLAVVDGSDEVLRAHAAALGPHVQWVGPSDVEMDLAWSGALGLPGAHNARNASMARAVLAGLGIAEATDEERLADAARDFAGLPSRCHSLGRVGSVEFVDDSLSTNVLPARAALDAFAESARGVARRGARPWPGLRAARSGGGGARAPTLVVTMPDNGPRIGAAVRQAAAGAPVIDADSLEEAVAAAHAWAAAEPDGVVLLSPAAPSFGRFGDYRERAEAFSRAAAGFGPLI